MSLEMTSIKCTCGYWITDNHFIKSVSEDFKIKEWTCKKCLNYIFTSHEVVNT